MQTQPPRAMLAGLLNVACVIIIRSILHCAA